MNDATTTIRKSIEKCPRFYHDDLIDLLDVWTFDKSSELYDAVESDYEIGAITTAEADALWNVLNAIDAFKRRLKVFSGKKSKITIDYFGKLTIISSRKLKTTFKVH